ncbi:N-terminal phage integrase SAM-like domain-containing protein [Micromonospora chalcea]|uniref:N-terminal phage integrase SAM-like domain-containing protein n=1 Tax=Micromonospora chalcea TaxID=1874 RepID=UPI003D7648E5
MDQAPRAGQGRPGGDPLPDSGEYAGYWLREIVKPNLAPGSYVTYEVVVRLYLVPGLGRKRLDKLRVSDVQTWINEVGRTCQCCAQGKDERRNPAQRRCCALGRCCPRQPASRTCGPCSGRCCPRRSPKG